MKPVVMILAVVSALLISLPSFARSSGHGAAHGFAGRAVAHGFVSGHGRLGRAVHARGFAPGRSFAFGSRGARGFRERFDGGRHRHWRRLARHVLVGGSFSNWAPAASAACSGPAIYEIGAGPRRRRGSRLPAIIYGTAPLCSAQSYVVGGPGVYSLD